MSWAHIFTTHDFWTGSLVTGVLVGVIAFYGTRASDRRKFAQEDKVLDRKDEREDTVQERKEARESKMRDDDRMYRSAKEFAAVVGEVLMNAIDTKGVFNAIRDMVNNATGTPDPMALKKLMFAQTASHGGATADGALQ
jgi:hypothetical protein